MSSDSSEGKERMEEKGHETSGEDQDRRLPPCTHAAEWAEHARFYEEDEPCYDGRAGTICGRRKGEDPCPVTGMWS
jgi:hypothetical protein